MKLKKFKLKITFILPTLNEKVSIKTLLNQLIGLYNLYEIEIIVIDDNSQDGTAELVREFAKQDKNIRLINRIDRFGLSSAIKEGCLNASNEIIAIMDSDGQHQVKDVISAIEKMHLESFDILVGSRFHAGSSIEGLSQKRERNSIIANKLARFSLSNKYRKLTDYMTGCIILNRESCLNYLKQIDVNGFKFLYELLSISKGKLKVGEVPLSFQSRKDGVSKLDVSILWDFFVSLIHTLFNRIIPRRAISFALVGSTGICVQLIACYGMIFFFRINFQTSLPISIILAASSNFLINNILTFRNKRLKNKKFYFGLFKFLLVSSLPIIANVGVATSFYNYISPNTFLSQMAGIIIVFIWNYAASSKFVWSI